VSVGAEKVVIEVEIERSCHQKIEPWRIIRSLGFADFMAIRGQLWRVNSR
jgi:hypothetical protein